MITNSQHPRRIIHKPPKLTPALLNQAWSEKNGDEFSKGIKGISNILINVISKRASIILHQTQSMISRNSKIMTNEARF